MNYQQRLERLEQRFLRADTSALINAACVEGAIILIQLIKDGKLQSNEAFDQLIEAANGTERGLAEFSQVALFTTFTLESADRNVMASKVVGTINGVTRRSPKPDGVKERSERLAAFCIELAEFVTESRKHVNTDDVVRSIVARHRGNSSMSQNDKADAIAKAITDDVWRIFAKEHSIKKSKRDYLYKLILDCDGKKPPRWLENLK
jgi:Holliday junction resolvasome RuvABC endonuclease subunit